MKAILAGVLFLAAVVLFLLSRQQPSAINHSVYETPRECLQCHPLALPTHRQNAPKTMTEDWPLDSKGRMTCITCHECITGTCFLRKSPPQLCQVCHDCSQGMACLLGTAHMGDSADIDAHIRDCLICHDGMTASAAGGPGEHAIDVFYLVTGDFKEVRDRRIVFVDGRITCISCHNPYRSEAARLVRSNNRSRLCLTCHRK